MRRPGVPDRPLAPPERVASSDRRPSTGDAMGSDRAPSPFLPPRWRRDAVVRCAVAGLFIFVGVAAWASPTVEGARPGEPRLDLSIASARTGQTIVATGSRFPRQ